MQTATTQTTTIIHDCTAQTAAEAARRRAAEKAKPFILFTKDSIGGWVIEDRYATREKLEYWIEYDKKWSEENHGESLEAGVDYLAVQVLDL